MTGLEALQSVQYVTAKGKRLAVIDADDWFDVERGVWIETRTDAVAQQLRARRSVSVAGGATIAGGVARLTSGSPRLPS